MTTAKEDVNVWEPYLTYAIYLAGTVQVIAILAAFLLPRQSTTAVQVRLDKVRTRNEKRVYRITSLQSPSQEDTRKTHIKDKQKRR